MTATEIGAYDAKTRLPELLREVAAGKRFIITLRGKPVAQIVPPTSDDPSGLADAMRRFDGMRTDHQVTQGLDIRSLREEGRE